MGQSKFKWIFVMENGETVVVEATLDDMMDTYWSGAGREEPVAIIRGDFAGG